MTLAVLVTGEGIGGTNDEALCSQKIG